MAVLLQAFLCGLLIYSAHCDSGSSCGFGYEILVARIENLENQLLVQQSEIKQLINGLVQSLDSKFLKQEHILEQRLEASEKGIKKQIELMMRSQSPRTTATIREVNRSREQTRVRNETIGMSMFRPIKPTVWTIPSCSEERTKQSGVYWLQPFIDEEPFEGYCEQEKFGGGWLVIQHRFNGLVDFYRKWADYKAGFGEVNGEHWLGLETLYRLTKTKKYTLVVEVEDYRGKYGYAVYNRFKIGSEAEQYKLDEQLTMYDETAGDALKWHIGFNFTTRDRDNDPYNSANSATQFTGAWWYGKNHNSNLNGPYVNVNSYKSNFWYDLNKKHEGLTMSRMMIKDVDYTIF